MVRFLYNDQPLEILVPLAVEEEQQQQPEQQEQEEQQEREQEQEQQQQQRKERKERQERKEWLSIEELHRLWGPLIPTTTEWEEECRRK